MNTMTELFDALGSASWGTLAFMAGYLTAQTYAVKRWGQW